MILIWTYAIFLWGWHRFYIIKIRRPGNTHDLLHGGRSLLNHVSSVSVIACPSCQVKPSKPSSSASQLTKKASVESAEKGSTHSGQPYTRPRRLCSRVLPRDNLQVSSYIVHVSRHLKAATETIFLDISWSNMWIKDWGTYWAWDYTSEVTPCWV